MTRYTNILQSGIGFFKGSRHVDRQEWHDFIQALDIQKNYPGMQGIGYTAMLTPQEVPVTVKEMRKEHPGFELKPQGKRDIYSAILYLEPLDKRNREAIGYDMFSQSTRRSAMELARDTGEPTMSGRVTLVQEIDEDIQAGMLIYLPLYKKGMPTDTVEARRKALKGFVYSPYRMGDLIDTITLRESLPHFEIYDTDNQTPEHLLYRSFKDLKHRPLYQDSKPLTFNDRTWSINFYSTEAFDKAQSFKIPFLITLGGLSLYLFLLLIIMTLTKSRAMMQEQAKTLNQLTQALEQSPNTTIITNLDGHIEYVNAAFIKATGYEKEEALGKRPSILKSGKTPMQTYEAMWGALTQGQEWHGEFINRRKDGSEYIESVNASPVISSEGTITHYMAVKEDITEKKRSQERIHHLANFDNLTGLPNRFQLMERLKYEISNAKRNKSTFSIMFLDLDHFKDINDTLGHSTGDALLIELSKRFNGLLREVDMVSRLGGDEFIFMLPHTDSNGIPSVAQKILTTIDKPVKIDHHELIVTASIGIAIYPDDGADAEALSKNADTAMYRAKQQGRNTYAFYTQQMQLRSTRNLQLTHALHQALAKEQFFLVYQPQIALDTNRVAGVETLLRWDHPQLGPISPAEFIPLAEESGLIIPIGEWVLEQAIIQAKSWIDQGIPPMTLSVNLSAVQFRLPNLTEMVTQLLQKYEMQPHCLELELTETVAMHDPQSAYNIISDLDKEGIRMAIDDFGTGYSSLSYLKKFQLSKLKIDQSFIRDISTDPEDKAIVAAIINMAKSLGLKTIAEGVETSEQLAYLKEQQCDIIQGYYFSRPLDAKALQEFILKQESMHAQHFVS